tara:strand:+ start:76 stop:522 length:447 start_codon:yes stop_codon:yes gene_type:complete
MEVRVYKSNKNMSPSEKKAHTKNLANIRQKRQYRKKKMEQLKNTSVKITTQKVTLNTNTSISPNYDTDTDMDTDSNTDDTDDYELMLYLIENLKCNNSNEDNENLKLIDLLEDKLKVNQNEKLNANGEFDKYIYSDYDSDSSSESISD